VRFRLTGDFSCLSDTLAENQYFPKDLYKKNPKECYIDCGAFDGDTIQTFLAVSHYEYSEIIAFEADPANYKKLTMYAHEEVNLKGKITCYQKALGASIGRIRFSATGLVSASIATNGEVEVDRTTLDGDLSDRHPTFLKMDIEGAEMDTLKGGTRVISKCQPLLAVCVYHEQSHLWEVPLKIRELQPTSSIFLRPYSHNGFELVCYGIPASRLKP